MRCTYIGAHKQLNKRQPIRWLFDNKYAVGGRNEAPSSFTTIFRLLLTLKTNSKV